jgi:gamma-glutamylcyclotransferase (GGCT)/AIG2-like uncharacterized protein YtfP
MDKQQVDLAALRQQVGAAYDEINALCQGKHWRMSIPAQADDSDEVFGEVLRSAEGLIDEVERLRAERAALPAAPTGYRITYDPREVVSYRFGDLPSAARALAEFVQTHDILHVTGFDNPSDKAWLDGIFAQMAMDTILELVDKGYQSPAPTPSDNPPF